MTAAFTDLLQFTAFLLRLPAVIAMPPFGPAQVIFCPADSLLALSVTMIKRGGWKRTAQEGEDDQGSRGHSDLSQYVGHGSSLGERRHSTSHYAGRVNNDSTSLFCKGEPV